MRVSADLVPLFMVRGAAFLHTHPLVRRRSLARRCKGTWELVFSVAIVCIVWLKREWRRGGAVKGESSPHTTLLSVHLLGRYRATRHDPLVFT